ncbi:PDZ domain-containing protein [Ferruginibacter paludis]|uniref:PDZ domain-containing protein n=1 Tax=Ferruginibacter paludis TaxID=1310417 RepID=UPI0025B29677|nr:PDZ domain-containing protein [Ferruginibacter paludis]MDN3655538.1 PDZ domain-containing protein [Ferruginibacter paludis]
MQCIFNCSGQIKLLVALNGNDTNSGTITQPFQSPAAAIAKAITLTGKDVVIEIRKGVYYLDKTIGITAASYQAHSLTIRGYKNEQVTISGAQKITPKWQPYKNGILQSHIVLNEKPDRLLMNGKNLPMARYPNYDSTARVFNGTAADAISDERVRNWQHPQGGFIHALHEGEWGDFHYLITGKTNDGKLSYEGGWQNNRPAPMHPQYRFVENIVEELDAPGEWWYDNNAQILYCYPPRGAVVEKAQFEVSHLTDLLHIMGNAHQPVKNIAIQNIAFTATSRSFMQTKEPLLRSDWTIYRGGAILLDGTENIHITNCSFSGLGGNAILLSNYNKNDSIHHNEIRDIGASGVVFVGNPAAVRSPAFRYELSVPWNEMDFTPGPKSTDYPQYCLVQDNLIHHIGTIEKQVAGVEIDMAACITVSHNTIYNTPRSGINIGDGCWGGHVIEFNDVFNTVLETGDHGAFNSWGRDRFWSPDRSVIDSIVAARPGIELLDVIVPNILRNNRFQCDHGWDIDLDDGSSNYLIYNNICLNGGLKLREGYHRTVTNNIIINNTFHPHVWLKNSGDIFEHNIVSTAYAPILMNNWGKSINYNFFLAKGGLEKAQQLGLDKNSLAGNAQFVNAAVGNYTIKAGSAAFKTGFKNVDDNVGVTSPALKKKAASPAIKPLFTDIASGKVSTIEWLGARFKNIETLGERSAAGMHDNHGAMLVELPEKALATKSNLQKGDVIIKLDNTPLKAISDLLQTYQNIKWMGSAECTIIRNQAEKKITIYFK